MTKIGGFSAVKLSKPLIQIRICIDTNANHQHRFTQLTDYNPELMSTPYLSI